MKKNILIVAIIYAYQCSGQTIIRDTSVLIAKEYCQNNATACSFGDNIQLNRMVIYNGKTFWKNYPRMLFYFTGLDLRNYQEKHNMDYTYLEDIEQQLEKDISNDLNRIVIINKKSGRSDSTQFKLYKMKFQYVYSKISKEFIPNFFNASKSSSYIHYPVKIYYITKIESIIPYNNLPLNQRRVKIFSN